MKQVTLSIPDTLDLNDAEAAVLFAAMLYEQGKLSLGQAAELSGLPKKTFSEKLGAFHVSLFNYPAIELSRDIGNA